MNDYFDRLFRFNSWANAALGNFLIDNNIEDYDCIRLMSHLQLAQSNWYKRIVGQQEDEPVWQVLELRPLTVELDNNGELWLKYVQTLDPDEFNNWVAYNNLAGQPQENTTQDLLAHVVNHATYHRGQVARRIRELGFTPPTTDYVLFARNFPAKRAI
ncbi:DinB family protein [Dyadobacter pollutisoli]|jgi:uncharacterized damage-inducible protein DinB|uniref:Damage-inducible protein DinB n=1 Tax=Dyadobacter pollutisoli TaxID=2910158 RepID=A0A9E8NHT0_9BACT|nr:DinB family protein [Dyadobacter pollutisoli]WAC15231.1 hypothetical protein ON006_14950 [Dyadobacter pollutisoli]